jgi:dCMP deaminase
LASSMATQGNRIKMLSDKWITRFLNLAEHVAGWSKDPSTKVGCVIVDDLKQIVSQGFNGFPRGIDDTPERYADRELKLKLVVHAEMNALAFAGRSVRGCTLFTWPFQPCCRCAAQIIQHGITTVISPDNVPDRWAKDYLLAAGMFSEAGVNFIRW